LAPISTRCNQRGDANTKNNFGKNRLKSAIVTGQHHVMQILKRCEELAMIQAWGEIAEYIRQVLSAAVIKPS